MILTDKNQLLSFKSFEIRDFLHILFNLSSSDILVLTTVIKQNLSLPFGHPQYTAQSTFGAWTNFSRKHINRVLKKLKKLHLLNWWKQDGKKTCHYNIHPYFYKDDIQERLALAILPFRFFIDRWKRAVAQEVTQLSLGSIYIKRGSSKLTDRELVSTKKDSHSTKKIVECQNIIRKISMNNSKLHHDIQSSNKEVQIQAVKYLSNHQEKIKQIIPNVTQTGAIRLLAYPEEVREYAILQLQKAKNLKKNTNLHIEFCKYASDYCSDNHIKPDWFNAFKILEILKLSKESPSVEMPKQETTFSKPFASKPQSWEDQAPTSYSKSTQEFERKTNREIQQREEKHRQQAEEDDHNPYIAALRIERALHDPQYSAAFSFWTPKKYNAWLSKLSREEQQKLIDEAHFDCKCPRNFISEVWYITDLNEAKTLMLKDINMKIGDVNETADYVSDDMSDNTRMHY